MHKTRSLLTILNLVAYYDKESEFPGLTLRRCCRYPKETMETVEELAFGIVQEYRESQKDRLKRTFVSGSDAAGAKVNRGKAKTTPAK